VKSATHFPLFPPPFPRNFESGLVNALRDMSLPLFPPFPFSSAAGECRYLICDDCSIIDRLPGASGTAFFYLPVFLSSMAFPLETHFIEHVLETSTPSTRATTTLAPYPPPPFPPFFPCNRARFTAANSTDGPLSPLFFSEPSPPTEIFHVRASI